MLRIAMTSVFAMLPQITFPTCGTWHCPVRTEHHDRAWG